jgi:predicted house-cleaning noncanonical NTP pyrophosphatase (MazG superfamily)
VQPKLIRDNIPDIIKASGITPITHIATDDEYRRLLHEKLQEEVTEFLADKNPEELADIIEVIYAILDLEQINKSKLEKIREEKAKKNGSFSKRIILDNTATH